MRIVRRRRRLGLSLFILLATSSCGKGVGVRLSADATADGVPERLEITPASAVLEVIDGVADSEAFTVTAIYANAERVDVTDEVTLRGASALGSFDGPLFTATGSSVGVAQIEALYDDVTATATVSVRAETHRVAETAPAGAEAAFSEGTTEDASLSPTLVYPPNEATVPRNLGTLDAHWTHEGVASDVYEVSLISEFANVHAYVGNEASSFAFTPAEWRLVSTGSVSVDVVVRGASTSTPGTVGTSTRARLALTDQDLEGGLYYWASRSSVEGAPSGIFRHDFANPDQPAEAFYTNQTESRCVACHVLSRDGTKMAITYDGGDGESALIDVSSRTPQTSTGRWNFGSYSPDASQLLTARQGVLNIRDANTGAPIVTVPAGAGASHPDWSPSGASIVYSLPNTRTSDWSFSAGSIVRMPYEDLAFGATVTLVSTDGTTNNYYPSVSPDDQWVSFNRSTEDAYDDLSASLWAVGIAGGTPIELARANQSPNVTNSWPRWAPFAQSVQGERMFWLTFSSKRNFGTRLVSANRPQIWMTPFFPDRAARGEDPSGPAIWLPFQDLATNNHIAQWTERIVEIQ